MLVERSDADIVALEPGGTYVLFGAAEAAADAGARWIFRGYVLAVLRR
jgi:hypothetical protein